MSQRDLADHTTPSTVAAAAVFLTTLSLAPTLRDGSWLLPATAMIVATAVIGTSFRLLAFPRWLVTCLVGVGLLIMTTLMFARDGAVLVALPGGDAWAQFSELARSGVEVMGAQQAPVTVTPGVQFLVVVGVAGIAWTVDAVAVTWRQAAIAGLPLLTLYLVPAVVLPDGVPWPLFVLAGIGWLMLLLADGRRELASWGRSTARSGVLHAVGGTGRRLGAAALAVALVVPAVLPSLDDGRFGFGTGDGDGAGFGPAAASDQQVTTLNPITNLRRDLRRGDDSVVLTYTTTTSRPDYFGVATLEGFDGFSWTMEGLSAGVDQQVSDGIPTPGGTSDQVAQSSPQYTVQIDGLDGRRLPVPYPPADIEIEGDWRYDSDTLDVFTPADISTLGLEYTVTQRALAPTVQQLRAAGPPETPDSSLTDLPEATTRVLGALPFRLTQRAASTYDQALMLQNWFRTRFTYSLDTVAGNDDDALRQFLEDRSGYCEQFAATMALMARALDIPARVVVGYTPGELTESGAWEITAHDAHAWPELWFEGIGWVRFEPTPGGGDGGGTPSYAPTPQDPTSTDTGGAGQGPIVIRRGGPRFDVNGHTLLSPEQRLANRGGGAFGGRGSASAPIPENRSSKWWLLLVLGAAAALAGVAPRTTQYLRRRRRWQVVQHRADAVHAAWADVMDACVDVDIGASPTRTPRDVADELPHRCRLSPPATDALLELAGWVERLRYSGHEVALPSIADIGHRSDLVRQGIYLSLAPRDRRSVTWWPASGRQSLMRSWNWLSERAAEASGTMAAAIRGWFSRRLGGAVPSAPRSGS